MTSPPNALKRAVFLDKDGTVFDDLGYSVDADALRFAPGAEEGLRLLFHHGFRLIVVSNQSGVARGLFPESALARIGARVATFFDAAGAQCDAFYYCPHHPQGSVSEYARSCACRKPEPGLLLQAASERGLDLARSWMVGNHMSDVEAGTRAGCRSVLISSERHSAVATAPDLHEAAKLIVGATPIHVQPGSRDIAESPRRQS